MSNKNYCFIIGSAKCGTTALADMLANHPEIDVSEPKETNFFTNKGIAKGFDWYESCFSPTKNSRYRLDASVSYSAGWQGSSKNIAQRIHDFAPDAKIVYLVRDPIERTRAAYWHAVRSGYEDLPLWEAIQNTKIDHVTASQYLDRINDYLAFFPEQNVHIISAHTLKSDTFATVNRLCRFLGIDEFKTLELQQDTNRTYQLSGLAKQLHRVLPYEFIKKSIKQIKRTMPKPVVDKLQALYSKPIPPLSEKEALYLHDLFLDETRLIKDHYDINLQHCHWWKQFGSQ